MSLVDYALNSHVLWGAQVDRDYATSLRIEKIGSTSAGRAGRIVNEGFPMGKDPRTERLIIAKWWHALE
jgi:hypothetical protein